MPDLEHLLSNRDNSSAFRHLFGNDSAVLARILSNLRQRCPASLHNNVVTHHLVRRQAGTCIFSQSMLHSKMTIEEIRIDSIMQTTSKFLVSFLLFLALPLSAIAQDSSFLPPISERDQARFRAAFSPVMRVMSDAGEDRSALSIFNFRIHVSFCAVKSRAKQAANPNF